MSRTWITDADLEGLEPPLACLTRKSAAKIHVFLGGQPTPHQWRTRKEARKWLEALAIVPVWRQGISYDYLYEGITLRPAAQINGQGAPILNDEVAFEGEPLEPPNAFLDAATTFEVPTEASIADLDSESHIPVAEALAAPKVARVHPLDDPDFDVDSWYSDHSGELEAWATRTHAHADARREAMRWIDLDAWETIQRIRDKMGDVTARLVDDVEGPFECGDVVLVGEDEFICELVSGHEGPHKDVEKVFEWGSPQFFGMGILGGGSEGSSGSPTTTSPVEPKLVRPTEEDLRPNREDIVDEAANEAQWAEPQCYSMCIASGERCIKYLGHLRNEDEVPDWHESYSGRHWLRGTSPATPYDPEDPNAQEVEGFRDGSIGLGEKLGRVVANRVNGGIKPAPDVDEGISAFEIEHEGEDFPLRPTEEDLRPNREDIVDEAAFEVLREIEAIGIPTTFVVSVRVGERMYTWERGAWTSHTACFH